MSNDSAFPGAIKCHDRYGRELLTVGLLRTTLDDAIAESVVRIEGPDGYCHVGSVGIPGEDSWSSLTLLIGPADASDGLSSLDDVQAADGDILTVGQLLKIASGLHEETHVTTENGDWYANISYIALPTVESPAVTFLRGVEVDSRQF